MEKWVILKLGQSTCKTSLDQLVMSGSKKSTKEKKKWKGGCQKDVGANLKELPMNKARIILATK